jgi:hypothetical protein
MQPNSRRRPISFYRGWRDIQYLSRFFDGQATEVSQFHNAALLGVKSGEFGQGVIQPDQIQLALPWQSDGFVQSQLPSAISLSGVSVPGVVNQYLAHEPRRYRKKVRAVFQSRLLLHQSEVHLIHQRSALQGVSIAVRL